MTPFEVLGLLTGLVVLAVVLGTFWQKWEDNKLARTGALEGLETLRKELTSVHSEVRKILNAS